MLQPIMRNRVLLALALAGSFLLLTLPGCSDTTGPGNGNGNGNGNGGDPPGFLNADGIIGGRMFDRFWASETGWDFGANEDHFSEFSDFYRCKQCHGWDLLGNAGAYISRSPRTTRPNVAPVNLKEHAAEHTAQELFDEIMESTGRRNLDADLASYDPATNSTVGDRMPNFSEFMTDAQVWALVKFLKEEVLDTDELYDYTTSGSYPTGSWTSSNIGKDGNAANGNALYADAGCAFCHGQDGKQIIVDGSYSVGSFFRQKGNEAQHKVKFGQLGTQMLNLGIETIDDMKDLYKAMADETRYPDP
jgi:mono/diheme cytochrome c family protein